MLGAFAYLLRELDEGAVLPVAFVEHEHGRGPSLYEYRPLVRAFVEERAVKLRVRDDAVIAIDELRREPAAAIFARAHAGRRPSEDEALFRTVLLGLLISTAEACGGFDWDDESFDRAYAELERSLFGERRTYTAIAPFVGLSVTTQFELAPGLRVRAVSDGELARHWPEAGSMVPRDFGRETDRYCVLELRAALAGAEEPPDAPAEIADAVSAIRLATAAPLSAGPVLFETLDGRPFGIRPVLPIAATQPPGEATRLDAFRGSLAAEILQRLDPRRRRQRSRRGARPLGAVAVPERAVPLRAAPRDVRRAPRRDVAFAGSGSARDRAGRAIGVARRPECARPW